MISQKANRSAVVTYRGPFHRQPDHIRAAPDDAGAVKDGSIRDRLTKSCHFGNPPELALGKGPDKLGGASVIDFGLHKRTSSSVVLTGSHKLDGSLALPKQCCGAIVLVSCKPAPEVCVARTISSCTIYPFCQPWHEAIFWLVGRGSWTHDDSHMQTRGAPLD